MKNKKTQVQVAEFLGIFDSQISYAISGKRRISLGIAKKIKAKTGLPLDFILEQDPKTVFKAVENFME